MESKFEQIKTMASTMASKNPQILVCGNRCNVANAMRYISEELRKTEENFKLQKIKEELGIIDIESSLTTMGTSSFFDIH